jgi:hypothetical protein
MKYGTRRAFMSLKVFVSSTYTDPLPHWVGAIQHLQDAGFHVDPMGNYPPEAKARPDIVMEHFPGQTLEAFMREHGPPSLDDVLTIARDMAGGMQAAHRRGARSHGCRGPSANGGPRG